MRKLLFKLVLFFFFINSIPGAQGQSLSLDSISGFQDTVIDNQVSGLQIFMSKTGGTVFTADLAILIHVGNDTSLAGIDTLFYDANYSLSGNTIGDTISVSYTYRAADYDAGDNIVVVWPASSQLPQDVDGDSIIFNVNFKNVGIQENDFLQSVQLFPNPASQQIRLLIAHPEKVEQVRVTDMLGKEMQHYSGAPSRISVYDLPGGIYFVEVKNRDGSFVAKKFFRE